MIDNRRVIESVIFRPDNTNRFGLVMHCKAGKNAARVPGSRYEIVREKPRVNIQKAIFGPPAGPGSPIARLLEVGDPAPGSNDGTTLFELAFRRWLAGPVRRDGARAGQRAGDRRCRAGPDASSSAKLTSTAHHHAGALVRPWC